jgi:hypothetical protein
MLHNVSPTHFRDDLTEIKVRVSCGEHLVATGVHQAPILIRPARRGDRGRHASLTHFRRNLHHVLHEAEHEPIIVTEAGVPLLWLGRIRDLRGSAPPQRRFPPAKRSVRR